MIARGSTGVALPHPMAANVTARNAHLREHRVFAPNLSIKRFMMFRPQRRRLSFVCTLFIGRTCHIDHHKQKTICPVFQVGKSDRKESCGTEGARPRSAFATDGLSCKTMKGPAGPWDVNTVAEQLVRSWRCTVEEVNAAGCPEFSSDAC